MRDTRPPDESPERRQRGSQLWFDPLLASCVRTHPTIDLKYGLRLDRFEQDAKSIKATCIDIATGQPVEVEADYLVACDGAGSGVRKALGIQMLGNPVLSYSVAIFFRSPDLYRRHGKGDTERFVLVGQNAPWGALTAIDGHSLWRLTLYRTERRPRTRSPIAVVTDGRWAPTRSASRWWGSGSGTTMPSGVTRPQRSARCQSVSSRRSSTRWWWAMARPPRGVRAPGAAVEQLQPELRPRARCADELVVEHRQARGLEHRPADLGAHVGALLVPAARAA